MFLNNTCQTFIIRLYALGRHLLPPFTTRLLVLGQHLLTATPLTNGTSTISRKDNG